MSNTKTNARILAVQTIYKYNYNEDISLENLIFSMLNLAKKEEYLDEIVALSTSSKSFRFSKEFYIALVKYTIQNINSINSTILNYLNKSNNLDELDPVVYSILLVAIGEIKLQKTPDKVIVNEYTNIAGSMLNNSEIGFINSILDKIIKANNK